MTTQLEQAWELAKQRFADVGVNVDDALRHLARRTSLGLGQPQRHVALKVPELRLRGRTEFGVDPGDGFEAFVQQRGQGQHEEYPPTHAPVLPTVGQPMTRGAETRAVVVPADAGIWHLNR